MSIHQQNSTLTKYYSVQYFFYKNKNILCAQARYPFRSSYIRWLSEQRRVCKRRTKIWLRLCATWPTHLWQQIRSPLSLHLQSYLFLLFISFWKDPRVRIFSCIMNATWLPLGYLCPWKEPHTAMLVHATSRADTFISMSACIQLPHAAALFHFMKTEGPEWKAPLFTPSAISERRLRWLKEKKKKGRCCSRIGKLIWISASVGNLSKFTIGYGKIGAHGEIAASIGKRTLQHFVITIFA